MRGIKASLARCLFTVSLVAFIMSCGEPQETRVREEKKAVSGDYGDIYHRETVRILREMWENEQEHIDTIAARLAEALRSGKTVVWDANAGHHAMFECDPTLPCLPKGGMRSSTDFSGNRENIDRLVKGDILVTNYINEQTYNAHERSVHVIGVTCSYFRNKKFGVDILKPNFKDLILDDISDDVFDTHMTEQMGLVHVPYIPEMKVGPGCGTFSAVVYWLMVSEVANRMAKGPAAGRLEYAPKYMTTLFDRLERCYREQRPAVWSAAREVALRIGGGGRMWVESEPRGVWATASGMSMGLVFTNHWPKEQMKAGDVLFVADVTSDPDSKMVQEARTAKERGLYLVASGPATQSELKKLADVYFDNLSPEGYGVFKMEGYENGIALLGSVVNNVLYNMFAIQMTQEMNHRGWYPKYYMSYIWQGASGGYFEHINWVVNRVGY